MAGRRRPLCSAGVQHGRAAPACSPGMQRGSELSHELRSGLRLRKRWPWGTVGAPQRQAPGWLCVTDWGGMPVNDGAAHRGALPRLR